jgi:hypothetical protein
MTQERRMAYLIGAVALGLAYYFAGTVLWPTTIVVVSVAFLAGVPVAMGYFAVKGVRPRSRLVAALVAWVPVLLVLGVLYLARWEGTICVILALPLLLLGASIGGVMAHARAEKGGSTEVLALVVLPLIMMPIERRLPVADRVTERVTAIDIAVGPARVWDEIADVDTIRAAERGRALYTAIGFPAPLAATLDHPQEGGVRIASFERGIEFVETITEWDAERRLSFAIAPRPSTAAPALDQHVAIGGPYFDVLEGTYALEGSGDTLTRLTLTSRYRVTTRFNAYAGWWADRVMASVQGNILAVIKARSESRAYVPKERIRAATRAAALRVARLPRESDSRSTGFSVVGDLSGITDIYADSVVVLVRDGALRAQRIIGGPQVLDSITASLALPSGQSWTAGTESNAAVLEWPTLEGDSLALGPMRRFTIPRQPGEAIDGRWVVFTNHLTVPKTADNPYARAWTYVHGPKLELPAP